MNILNRNEFDEVTEVPARHPGGGFHVSCHHRPPK
jgi:hypothetical protein